MATVDTSQSQFDVAKLVVAILVLGAGIYGFHYFENQAILLYRILGLLAIAVVSLIIAYQTALGKYLWQYLRDARVEMRKLVKPTRAETVQTTIVVAVVVVLVGVSLWGLDLLFGWLIQKLLAI